jgi:hypothetical protein
MPIGEEESEGGRTEMNGWERTSWRFLCLVLLLVVSCVVRLGRETEIKKLPLDQIEEIIDRSAVVLDLEQTADGGGSVRIEASGPTTIRLIEIGDLDIEDARLVYRAQLRTEELSGRAYLEMWCAFGLMGEYFSRAIPGAVSGTVDWTSQETPFLLRPGENPEKIRLNLVIDGVGTVWIDDVRLLRAPLGSSAVPPGTS